MDIKEIVKLDSEISRQMNVFIFTSEVKWCWKDTFKQIEIGGKLKYTHVYIVTE